MDREKIMADIKKLQDKTDAKGFKGQNEYDLYLREEIVDYIAKLFDIGVVINSALPEWLDADTRQDVRYLWENKMKVAAIKEIKAQAKDRKYIINIRDAITVIEKHCL